MMLKLAIKVLPSRKRLDAISIMNWLPRFLRHHFLAGDPYIAFMIASVVRDHPNVVNRSALIRVLDRIASGSPWRQSTIPDYIMQGLMTPAHASALAYPQFPRLPTLLAYLPSFRASLLSLTSLRSYRIGVWR